MKIAVPHKSGEVYGHFGHSEEFKIYDIQDNAIVKSEVFKNEASGHDAIAALMSENNVDVVICGGLGEGAKNALESLGIKVVTGAQGIADHAVMAYLAGEEFSSDANCSEDAEGGCGGCSGSCGGCSGGCHAPAIEGPNVGKNVRVHYEGTLNDGTKFDSSYDRGETLDFVCGAGMMIRGFDTAVANMEVGQIVNVHLAPEEAYGPVNPNMILKGEQSMFPGCEGLNVGDQVYLQDTLGRPVPAKVTQKDETTITFDANHELAGQELNFKIELVEIQ